MRSPIIGPCCAVLLVASAIAEDSIHSIKCWEKPPMRQAARKPPTSGRSYEPVLIDTSISGVRFIYGHNQAWTQGSSLSEDWWHFFCFNDNHSRVNTIIFLEEHIHNPTSWVQHYLLDDQSADLRYTTAQIVELAGEPYPQAFYHIGAMNAVTYYSYDQGGMGAGAWISPVPLNDPSQFPNDYSAYMPSTCPAQGTGDTHMHAEARGFGDDSHIYWKSDKNGSRIVGPTEIFYQPDYPGDPMIFRPGWECHQIVSSRDGMTLAICTPAHRISDENPDWDDMVENPLLPVLRISRDAGITWGDAIWIDKFEVPELPGINPGCESLNEWAWHKRIALSIDSNNRIHLLATITDPANYNAYNDPESFGVMGYGLYHVLGQWNENEWAWSANFVTNGTGIVPPGEYGSTWICHPKISKTPDGRLVCLFSDVGYIDPSNDSGIMDVYMMGSTDGGATWGAVDEGGEFEEGRLLNVTGTDDVDEVYVKLIKQTTLSYVTAYGFQEGYATNGPLLAWFVPLEDLFWENCTQFDIELP